MDQKVSQAIRILCSTDLLYQLDSKDYDILGYDTYKFGYYGIPKDEEIKARCNEIIFNYIEELEERLTRLEKLHDREIRESLGKEQE
jgi:hypothetical protein